MTHANQGKRLQNMILSVDAALKDCLQGSQGCPSIGTAHSCVDRSARQTPSVRAGKDNANGVAVTRCIALSVSHPGARVIP